MEIFFYTWNIFLGDKNGYHKIQVLKKQNKTNPKKPKPNKQKTTQVWEAAARGLVCNIGVCTWFIIPYDNLAINIIPLKCAKHFHRKWWWHYRFSHLRFDYDYSYFMMWEIIKRFSLCHIPVKNQDLNKFLLHCCLFSPTEVTLVLILKW